MRITDLQKLTDEKWLNLFAARFEHNGHAGRWVFASRRPRPHTGQLVNDAVVIAAVLRNPGEPPRLVVVREFRVPAGGYVYGLPAGLVDPGEGVEETIRRELREETGLELAAVKRVTQPLFSSAGLTDEAAALAFVDVRGSADARPYPEASEDIEVLLLDHAAVCRLCDDRSAWIDVKAWAVLHMYQLLGRLE
jgi:ADP-ribose pyrophosphatase